MFIYSSIVLNDIIYSQPDISADDNKTPLLYFHKHRRKFRFMLHMPLLTTRVPGNHLITFTHISF